MPRERTDANRLTAWGKAVYRRRKETVERSFADAKQLHGHRYARFRSLVRVRLPVPACRRSPEHQEDRPGAQPQAASPAHLRPNTY